MPIYEYNCKKCNTVSEFLVGISQEEEIKCKKCGSKDVQKIMSRSGVVNADSGGGCENTGCPSAGQCGMGGHKHSGGCCGGGL